MTCKWDDFFNTEKGIFWAFNHLLSIKQMFIIYFDDTHFKLEIFIYIKKGNLLSIGKPLEHSHISSAWRNFIRNISVAWDTHFDNPLYIRKPHAQQQHMISLWFWMPDWLLILHDQKQLKHQSHLKHANLDTPCVWGHPMHMRVLQWVICNLQAFKWLIKMLKFEPK